MSVEVFRKTISLHTEADFSLIKQFSWKPRVVKFAISGMQLKRLSKKFLWIISLLSFLLAAPYPRRVS